MTEERVTIDGVPMRWLTQGAGTPVVLVHGIPTSPALFRHVTPLLEGMRVLSWEMVGYGESIPAGRDRDISVRAQARYLRFWLRALEIDRAILVGHDLGGGVVQIAAIDEPQRCAGLVLTNAIGYDSWPIPSVRALRAAGGLAERMTDGMLEKALAMLIRRGHRSAEIARESTRLHFAPYARHDGARALVRQVRALNVEDTISVQDDLPQLSDRPARVVWGAADRFQKLPYGQRMSEDLKCELEIIPGGKHFVPEDEPEILARAIRDVVTEVEHAVEALAAEEE